MADLTDYTGLITSEHNQRPKFMATVSALGQSMVDLQNVLGSMPAKFDLDAAEGDQLDSVGEWVGISRYVATPLTGVYFSLDTAGVGFDQGVWKGPFDPDNGLTRLDDDTYRLVIRAKIGANHWDGTLESSAEILNSIFSPGNGPVAIHANGEPFGIGDGSTAQFQLLYQGQPVYQVSSATLYRNDWQGNQQLYPTPRTNYAKWSQDFTNAQWTKSGATITGAPVGAPDGSANAQKLIAAYGTGASGGHSVFQQQPTQGAGQYFVAQFACAAEFSRISLWLRDNANNYAACTYNLQTGTTIAPGVSGTGFSNPVPQIYPVPNAPGWYLCILSASVDASITTVNPWVRLINNAGTNSFVGDDVSGVYTFGLQYGALTNVVGSYIPTTTTAVTQTDYTLGPTGIAQLAVPPVSSAALTWTGDGQIYPSGTYVFIQDNQDMSMTIGVAGKAPSAVFLALLEGGYIPIKPEGVRIDYVIVTSVDGVPMFGFDVSNQFIMGFDAGAWGTPL